MNWLIASALRFRLLVVAAAVALDRGRIPSGGQHPARRLSGVRTTPSGDSDGSSGFVDRRSRQPCHRADRKLLGGHSVSG